MTCKYIELFLLGREDLCVCALPFREVFQLMTAKNQQSILSTITEAISRISGEWFTDNLQFSPIFRSTIFASKK